MSVVDQDLDRTSANTVPDHMVPEYHNSKLQQPCWSSRPRVPSQDVTESRPDVYLPQSRSMICMDRNSFGPIAARPC